MSENITVLWEAGQLIPQEPAECAAVCSNSECDSTCNYYKFNNQEEGERKAEGYEHAVTVRVKTEVLKGMS